MTPHSWESKDGKTQGVTASQCRVCGKFLAHPDLVHPDFYLVESDKDCAELLLEQVHES